MKQYKLNAIGHITESTDHILLELTAAAVPAMKNLSLFSHALLIFADGTDSLYVRPVMFLAVDEENGTIMLEAECGLQHGNTVYDIKPYMPCEDRITDARCPKETTADRSRQKGGQQELMAAEAGMIRREKGRYYLYPADYQALKAAFAGCSHIRVIWWFSRFDQTKYRRATQGDPPYENAPRSGIFATRSPVRPNPVALTVVRVIAADDAGKRIEVSGLDCFDGTPMLGIRPYFPETDRMDNVSVPPWLAHWPDHKDTEEDFFGGEIKTDEREERILEAYSDTSSVPGSPFLSDAAEGPKAHPNQITVSGARQNNLKNVSLILPKGKVIAMAGVSGSGKSSLAFDTIYAESRLRLTETADSMEKPEADSITGLPPAVAVAQRAIGRNPRSSVGTFTGIQDRLRLLYAAIGRRHCPNPKCGRAVNPRSRDELVNLLSGLSVNQLKITPYGSREQLLPAAAGQLAEWESCVDRALELGQGAFFLQIEDHEEILMQNRQMCYHCKQIMFEMSPAVFSFNNPESMCSVCSGLGKTTEVDSALIVEHPELSLLDGASGYWGDLRAFRGNPTANWMRGELLALAEAKAVDLEMPWQDLPEEFRQAALYGSGSQVVSWSYVHPRNGRSGTITRPVEGAVPVLNRLLRKGGSTAERIAGQYVRAVTCPACHGERLGREGRMVTVGGFRYPQTAGMTIEELLVWVRELPAKLNAHQISVSRPLLQDVYMKAARLKEMGLAYLNLDRAIPTLSGGELQRLKLVAQMGIGLSGLLYVMDEPTAGLHPRDYQGILTALRELRDEGNTVLVVEHEEMILRGVDWLVEVGPGAGSCGGEIVWQGRPEEVIRADTQTGHFLSGQERIVLERPGLPGQKEWVQIYGAKGNNLKDVDITFPKGRITCITGVSGSGKSTLTGRVIAPAVEALNAGKSIRHFCSRLEGITGIKSVVHASQAPIGRSSRSNIMTYMGILDEIRKLFAATAQARAGKLTASAFSFNSKEGQCDTCKGEGVQVVAVPFAADIRTICPVCAGRRYKQKVLAVLYRDKSIFDITELSIEQALEFFRDQENVAAILEILCDVGLGYLKLGQGTPTLSGGEGQRLKLARVLIEKQNGPVLYILDEPTAGLHFSDIRNLLVLLSKLAAEGHTILLIEHNCHVIRNADWIIDLGPEGGAAGGQVIAQGTPETVMNCLDSHTGAALSGEFSDVLSDEMV